ncbi:hypothetical protein C8J57DRAFT_1568021 [Mycena rebaudengoi]|nr:hypothetical protein C8J57DRAFT_1568021 [Mycena rebaudengoi]
MLRSAAAGTARTVWHCVAPSSLGFLPSVSAYPAASHRHSCAHLSILIFLPFPPDAPSPAALIRLPHLPRSPSAICSPSSSQIFLKPSEAYSTTSALHSRLLNLLYDQNCALCTNCNPQVFLSFPVLLHASIFVPSRRRSQTSPLYVSPPENAT